MAQVLKRGQFQRLYWDLTLVTQELLHASNTPLLVLDSALVVDRGTPHAEAHEQYMKVQQFAQQPSLPNF